MKMLALGTTALAAIALMAGAAEAAPKEPGTPASAELISRADATKAAQAALADCIARGQPASVVILDAEGFQRAAFSDDGAKYIGLHTSAQKAASVLAFGVSTRELQARVASDPHFAEQFGKDERYHFSPGGLPIYRKGKLVAIIAVGGAMGIDEECARAGLKALGWGSASAAGE